MPDLNDFTPPQYAYNLLAEQSLLKIAVHGDPLALQLCRDLIGSFWDARHGALSALLARMFTDSQHVDPVTVMSAIVAQGLVGKVPGPFLHSVISGPGEHEGVLWYADQVREMAGRRKLREAALRLSQQLESGWAIGDDLSVRGAMVEFRGAMDGLEASMESPDALGGPQSMAEFLDGPTEEDWLVPGLLERSERMILTGNEGLGKALDVTTPIPTPKGWTTMGGLTVGQEVFGPDGQPTLVVAATDVMVDRPCYRVTFSDGARIVADAGHLWLTETLAAREATAQGARRGPTKPRGTDQRHLRKHFPEVVTTRRIAETMHARGGHAVNHSVDVTQPLQYPAQEVPIDPYVLGAWLGDGTSRYASLTCADEEIIEHIQAAGEQIRKADGRYLWRFTDGVRRGPGAGKDATMQGRLRALGVLGSKHIPGVYQRSSVPQRLSLLQGLMDTDGTVCDGSSRGRGHGAALCEFSVCAERLARDVHELLLGLGMKVTWREAPAVLDGRVVGTRYRLAFQTDLPVFRLTRKADRLQPLRTRRARLRYITAVDPAQPVAVRCIQVDRPDGMFVAGRECIPTHNSVLCRQVGAAMAGSVHPFSGAVLGRGDRGIRVTAVDCENSAVQSRRGYRSVIAQVDRVRTTAGLGKVDWKAQMSIDIRPEGLDLLNTRDVAHLEHIVAATVPDLLVLGPLYKIFNADPSDERAVRQVAAVLDGLRARHRFALLLEAHPGKGEGADGARRMAPIGSSLWMRWPEYGFGIRRAPGSKGNRAETVDVVSWRGSREERSWPQRLRHSRTLPWAPVSAAEASVEDQHAELDVDDPQGWYR